MTRLLQGALLPVLFGLVFCSMTQAQRVSADREYNGRFGAAVASRDAETTDRIIVKWRSAARMAAANDADIGALAGRGGLRLQRLRSIGNGMQVLQLDRDMSAPELADTLQRLRADPNVELVEADRRLHAHTFTPNDPLYVGQWYLQNTQPAAIHANDAWDVEKGGATAANSGTVIAVIDTGVRFDHPDLLRANAAGKLLPGFDFVSSDSPGNFSTANDGDGWDSDPSDPGDFLSAADLQLPMYKNRDCGTSPSNSSWHGTRVAGMIAANSNNGVGVAGAAFNAWILPVRALGKCGGFDSDILAAMYWAAGLSIPSFVTGNQTVPAANPYPANIINMSLGATGSCSSVYVAAVNAISARGVLIVVSAGNEGARTDTPANCPGVLGVGGLRHVGTKVGYSNLGPEVGVSAPAGNCVNIAVGSPCLFSLDTTSNNGTTTPGTTDYTNQISSNVGTSFSAPLAAATGGLMHETNARLSPTTLIARIRSSATPFPTTSDTVPTPPQCHVPANSADVQSSECLCTTAVCGAGMLNAASAVNEAQRPVAVIVVSGSLTAGAAVTLDGSGSAASCRRTVASYGWSVVTGTGSLTATTSALSSILVPASGSVTVRLTVTDNLGAADSADAIVAAGGATTTSPTLLAGNACATPIVATQASAPVTPSAPSAPASSGGGGGAFGIELLLLTGIAVARLRRRLALPQHCI
jgi:serine protease